jgi:hypothetical protein
MKITKNKILLGLNENILKSEKREEGKLRRRHQNG